MAERHCLIMGLCKRTPDSQVWWVDITLPGRPRLRKSTGTTDRLAAEQIHDVLQAELWATTPGLTGRTWYSAVTEWCDVPGRGDPDKSRMAFFNTKFKDRPLRDVTRADLIAALAFCKTPANYNRYRSCISAILHLVQENEWIDKVPKLPVKPVATEPRQWITHDQWERLRVELPPHLQAAATFAITTGLRQSNVLGLRWDHVDLVRRLAWIEGNAAKSGKPIAVPLAEDAVAVLQSVQGQHPEFVFTFRGKPIAEIKTAFMAALRRAELVGFTWHGLRHTWATWHIQAGTPIEVLKALGAWRDLRMVLNYAHHSAGHLAGYADNIKKKT